MFHSHRRHHSAPNTPYLGGSSGGFNPRELAVDAAAFAGTEALLHRYENQHHEGHHQLRDAAIAGAAAFGVHKLQNHHDQQQAMMYAPQQQYAYQQPYGAPYNYYGGAYAANPYQGYGGGGGYNVYNGYNTYNMYGGDMYQNPYMPYQQHYHRRHMGGLFGGAPYNGAFPPRYTIMPPGQNSWGMQPYF
ncbi:hypothetical protein Unana1_03408 [Umbelopsis nana]|jgi:hypothetical protein